MEIFNLSRQSLHELRKPISCHSFHIDFIDGLSAKEAAVDFIKYYTCAAGIVTTKNAQIKRARTLELYCIQRFFVFDAISQNNIRTQIAACNADAIEILPGVIPSVIRDLSSDCRLPFITGGFINSQKEVETALHCGASNINHFHSESVVHLAFIDFSYLLC